MTTKNKPARPVPEEAEHEKARRMLDMMNHSDWFLMEEAYQNYADAWHAAMDNAESWDDFVAARAVREFIQGNLLPMRDGIRTWLEQQSAPTGFEDEAGENPLED